MPSWAGPSFNTDITGYDNEHFLSGQGLSRMVSNFAIYPKQKVALSGVGSAGQNHSQYGDRMYARFTSGQRLRSLQHLPGMPRDRFTASSWNRAISMASPS